MRHNISLLIPTYSPNLSIVSFIADLAKSKHFEKIVIVNDGSDVKYNLIFNLLKKNPLVKIITHKKNQGKGAAIKTGIRYLSRYKTTDGIITADSDGQHAVKDIIKIKNKFSKNINSIILGCRIFKKNVPLRSRIGNLISIFIYQKFAGIKVSDTQTGLRAIPKKIFADIKEIKSNRYEFETEMLIVARNLKIDLKEVKIKTIYLNNNESSHFNPLFDSMKIYFTLFRSGLSSFFCYIIDYLTFITTYQITSDIKISNILGRTVVIIFYFYLMRNFVFSSNKNKYQFIKFLILVLFSGSLSIFLQNKIYYFFLHPSFSKLTVETILFFINFYIMKTLIFKK